MRNKFIFSFKANLGVIGVYLTIHGLNIQMLPTIHHRDFIFIHLNGIKKENHIPLAFILLPSKLEKLFHL